MKISMIAALDDKRGIAREGRLPWRLSTDMKRFKALTMGHHLIMGRKTFESIGRPLPGRINIVVTRQKDYQFTDIVVTHSIEEALRIAEQSGDSEAFVIGGGKLYKQLLPQADCLYLTRVYTDSHADIFFPELGKEWEMISSVDYPASEEDDFSTSFIIYKRA